MTALVRRNPFDELASWWPRDLFARFGSGTLAGEWSPTCDVTEDERSITVHAELPGVAAGDMDVTVSQGMLTIRGEKRIEKEGNGNGYSERFFGSFERSLAIPANVDEANIKATLKDGVLEVLLPKSEPSPAPTPRKVEITPA